MTFRWPWISAARHDDVVRIMGNTIAERDTRITQLERERQELWDTLAFIGIGKTIFHKDLPVIEEQPSEPSKPAKRSPVAGPMRPSAITRMMEAKAQARYELETNRRTQTRAAANEYFDNLEPVIPERPR